MSLCRLWSHQLRVNGEWDWVDRCYNGIYLMVYECEGVPCGQMQTYNKQYNTGRPLGVQIYIRSSG